MASEKVRGILTRENGRDIFDLNFVISKKDMEYNERLIKRKLDFYHMKVDTDAFKLKLKQREKLYYRELKPIVHEELPDFDYALYQIIDWIEIK